MVTVKIKIKNHLAEYIRGKFNDCNDGPVSFPDRSDLYVQIWDLLSKRPANAPIDQGNLEICLPNRSFGKNPDYYNYLSERSVKLLSKSIEALMYYDLHDRIRQRQIAKHPLEVRNIKETIYEFLDEFGIYSISHDAFYKEYYRLREKERYRRKMMKKGEII
jgi:hypothetical protein